jgi:hypothetical protein
MIANRETETKKIEGETYVKLKTKNGEKKPEVKNK